MSGKYIREKFMRKFVGMAKHRRQTAWLIVAWYITQIAATIVAGHYLLTKSVSFATATLMVIAAIFIATRLRGLNNIVHECTHYSFSDHRQDNVAIGSLCSSILTGCFQQYKDEHLSHHAHLGDYELDMDLKGIKDLRLHEPLTKTTIIRHMTNPLLGRHLRQYSGVNFSGRDGRFFQLLKVFMLLTIIGFTVVAPLTLTFFVLIPLFYLFPTFNYWTDCLDHAGVVGSEDELESSRNVLAPKFLRPLLFPRNDCFHLVHHLFPQVPARHLSTVHDELCNDPIYQEQKLAVQPIHQAVYGLVTQAS
ncbi:MAG: fatty acid desaturase [Paracoccaceae bacterium]